MVEDDKIGDRLWSGGLKTDAVDQDVSRRACIGRRETGSGRQIARICCRIANRFRKQQAIIIGDRHPVGIVQGEGKRAIGICAFGAQRVANVCLRWRACGCGDPDDQTDGFISCERARARYDRVCGAYCLIAICLLYTSPSPRD